MAGWEELEAILAPGRTLQDHVVHRGVRGQPNGGGDIQNRERGMDANGG